MRIVSQFARGDPCPLPPALRVFRLLLRIGLVALGVYAVVRGVSLGKQQNAEQAAAMKARLDAYQAELDAENAVFMQDLHRSRESFDADVQAVYREINTLLAATGLPPIGDGR